MKPKSSSRVVEPEIKSEAKINRVESLKANDRMSYVENESHPKTQSRSSSKGLSTSNRVLKDPQQKTSKCTYC